MLRKALVRVGKGGSLNISGLLRIGNLLRVSRRFSEFMKRKEEEESFPILEAMAEGLVEFKALENKITTSIVGENEIADRA